MNYLAHAFLSFDHPKILAGNMISDFVKGKKQYDYESMIQKGIQLHRAIDTFTDTHPAIKEMKKPFQQKYGLYSGAFTDVACDYFLASQWNEFSHSTLLADFSKRTYEQLESQLEALPDPFQQYFFYMKKYDWLFNYQYDWQIKKSFAGLAVRAKYMSEGETAFQIFQESKDKMRPYFLDFFPLLNSYSLSTFKKLESIS